MNSYYIIFTPNNRKYRHHENQSNVNSKFWKQVDGINYKVLNERQVRGSSGNMFTSSLLT